MDRKIRFENPQRWAHHRSGWAVCVDRLRAQLELPTGMLCVDTEEKIMRLTDGQSITEDFLLISHFVPFGVSRFPEWSLRAFGRNPRWLNCRSRCRGAVAFTRYAAEYVREFLAVPADHVLHATEPAKTLFSFEDFVGSPRKDLVMVGWWLRKFSTLAKISAPGYARCYLPGTYDDVEPVPSLLKAEGCALPTDCPVVPYLPNDEFDRLLARSLVLLDFHDTSANNSIVECMARRTPMLIRRMPPVVEHLGPEYPLYFGSLGEAETKLQDLDLIRRAHEYLGRADIQARIDMNTFAQRFADTTVYQSL